MQDRQAPPATAADIANGFVAARRAARPLAHFPGELPASLDAAYAVQDEAIRLWGAPVVGWKVALIHPDLRARHGGEERLVGPVFAGTLVDARNGPVEAPVFDGGFAAIEAELAVRLGADLPAREAPYGLDDVARAVEDLFLAVEVASSPLATINDLGPTAVISGFGNNAGIILGPAVTGWRDAPPEALATRVVIDGETVGEGSAAKVPGGPLGALVFAANCLSSRGRGLKAGDIVSTGATTGIHPVRPGMAALVSSPAAGEIRLSVTRAVGEG